MLICANSLIDSTRLASPQALENDEREEAEHACRPETLCRDCRKWRRCVEEDEVRRLMGGSFVAECLLVWMQVLACWLRVQPRPKRIAVTKCCRVVATVTKLIDVNGAS